jgi:Tol biopolymer transport system component
MIASSRESHRERPVVRRSRPVLALARYAALGVLLLSANSGVAGGRGSAGAALSYAAVTAAVRPLTVQTVTADGGRMDWSPTAERIAFDRLGPDGYFDIYSMVTDGSDVRCLTCDKPGLPNKSMGNPAWHPTGNYIAFQAQNAYTGLGDITDYFANPGSGLNNDLWIMDKDGARFWQITTVPNRLGAVLHPQFSRQGDRILWSERLSSDGGKWGTWALKLADFRIDSAGVPHVDNIRTLQPGAQHQMYESHGFSPDGRQLLFSGNLEVGQAENAADIYLYDPVADQLKNLTQTMDEWDEHAHFSPDGNTIVWMTNKSQTLSMLFGVLRTDYWTMNIDGSNKRRLTYFNDFWSPQFVSGGVIAADATWSPDGRRLAAYLITDLRRGGKSMVIGLPPRVPAPAPPAGIRTLTSAR